MEITPQPLRPLTRAEFAELASRESFEEFTDDDIGRLVLTIAELHRIATQAAYHSTAARKLYDGSAWPIPGREQTEETEQ